MVKISVQTDCENAPKKAFIRDFEISFAQSSREDILNRIDDAMHWEMVGEKVISGRNEVEKALDTMLDGTMKELLIETIITHGDTGAGNGTMAFEDGSTFSFCDIFKFTSHGKDAKIKKLQSYVVEIKS